MSLLERKTVCLARYVGLSSALLHPADSAVFCRWLHAELMLASIARQPASLLILTNGGPTTTRRGHLFCMTVIIRDPQRIPCSTQKQKESSCLLSAMIRGVNAWYLIQFALTFLHEHSNLTTP